MTSDESKTTDGPERCPMCPAGTLQNGSTTLTLERDGSTIVFKNIPADVCDTCGESFVDEDVSASVCKQAEAAVEAGVEVDVRRFRVPAKTSASASESQRPVQFLCQGLRIRA